MSQLPPLDPANTRIVERLHATIATLIHGNQIDQSEVRNLGARACPCHLSYEVRWRFVPNAHIQRVIGNGAVSTHFGDNRHGFDAETTQRCEMGRTHQPIRQPFIDKLLRLGGTSLGLSGQPEPIWDFGQHSVHVNCRRCGATGNITCGSCHGSGRETCFHCHGSGSTTETRWVSDHRGQGRSEHYQQSCSWCGASGRVTCRRCQGSGSETCPDCQGHGFFTDICHVTVDATPSVTATAESSLSQNRLLEFLLRFPVSQVVRYIDFDCTGHRNAGNDAWLVAYQASTTTVELDVGLRGKQYMAAAIGEHALSFIKPPIFDDVFIEELTDLKKIWSGRKKAFSNDRAQRFFVRYSGQPVLDRAMKAVAKLKGRERAEPGNEVLAACDSYISIDSAKLLGQCMASLLDKVSPPNSLWSWTGVMALPFLLLFLGAQNWLERNAPDGYFGLTIVWLLTAQRATLLTLTVSPLAASLSALVSAIRRRAVPAEYRQHGRNWQPLKRFVWFSIGIASLGASLGWLSHQNKLPRWDNFPINMIEETLNLNHFIPYAQAAAGLKKIGFFVPSPANTLLMPTVDLVVLDIQNNLKRLGYKVTATGQIDNATQQAVAAYVKKRKLNSAEPQAILASLCKDLRGACANISQIK